MCHRVTYYSAIRVRLLLAFNAGGYLLNHMEKS